MRKAVNLSTSFASFSNLCRVYCNNKKVDMPKLNINEEEVFKTISETRVRIHEALCDDFNTCLVIDELFSLTNLINKEFQSIYDSNLANSKKSQSNESDLNRHYGCVMSVCQFIESYLELFGLQLENKSNKSVIRIDKFKNIKAINLKGFLGIINKYRWNSRVFIKLS